MSLFSYNDIYKEQNKRLIASTFKKAFITAIHPGTSSIDVYFAENPQSVVRNIPASSAIDFTKIQVGDKCRVDVFDEKNIRDMVVAYAFGRKF